MGQIYEQFTEKNGQMANRVSKPLVIREVQLKIKVTKKHHGTPTRPVKTEKKQSVCLLEWGTKVSSRVASGMAI